MELLSIILHLKVELLNKLIFLLLRLWWRRYLIRLIVRKLLRFWVRLFVTINLGQVEESKTKLSHLSLMMSIIVQDWQKPSERPSELPNKLLKWKNNVKHIYFLLPPVWMNTLWVLLISIWLKQCTNGQLASILMKLELEPRPLRAQLWEQSWDSVNCWPILNLSVELLAIINLKAKSISLFSQSKEILFSVRACISQVDLYLNK